LRPRRSSCRRARNIQQRSRCCHCSTSRGDMRHRKCLSCLPDSSFRQRTCTSRRQQGHRCSMTQPHRACPIDSDSQWGNSCRWGRRIVQRTSQPCTFAHCRQCRSIQQNRDSGSLKVSLRGTSSHRRRTAAPPRLHQHTRTPAGTLPPQLSRCLPHSNSLENTCRNPHRRLSCRPRHPQTCRSTPMRMACRPQLCCPSHTTTPPRRTQPAARFRLHTSTSRDRLRLRSPVRRESAAAARNQQREISQKKPQNTCVRARVAPKCPTTEKPKEGAMSHDFSAFCEQQST
jgi:hypothetical protein